MTYRPLLPQQQVMISQLWRILSSDGIPPHKAVEQLSYLLALKLLARDYYERGTDVAVPSPAVLWSELIAASDESLLERARGAIEELHTGACGNQALFRSASLIISKVSLLREVLSLIDELFSPVWSREWHAHIYDALLATAEEAAAAWATPGGKFYTPAHFAHLLCSLVRPQPGEKICDYACGNGRLLAAAYTQIVRSWCDPDKLRTAFDGQPFPLDGFHQWTDRQREMLAQTQLVGMDIDESAVLQTWVRLRCLGVERPRVSVLDTLSNQIWQKFPSADGSSAGFDVLLANPPYGSRVDGETLDESLRGLNTSKAELLFVGRALQLLRPGGRAALIVPDSVLFHHGKAAVTLRQTLVTEHGLRAIVSLPAGVFAPYTNVKTSILVLTNSGMTGTIWCYSVEQDGYTLDKRRRLTPEQSDLPDLVVKYSLRFADTLSSCRPSAFINGDTELQWSNIEPERQAYHYAQPIVEQELLDAGEQTANVACFKTTLARPLLTQPKHWEVRVDQLDEHFTLLPGRYQPFIAVGERPGYPPDYPARPAPLSSKTEARILTDQKTQQDSIQVFYLPGVKDLPTLAQWYREGLKKLRGLYRQGQIDAKQHLESLRLLALIRSRQEKKFRHPSPS